MISTKTALALMTAGAIIFAVPHAARADDDHNRNPGGQKHYIHDDDEANRWEHHNGSREAVVIQNMDREHIEEYMRAHHHDHHKGCPPGLAKKHNGCVPAGHDMVYVIGQPLPPQVVYEPAPVELVRQLTPAPDGYQYVQVDQDTLLVSEATKKVIDAVTLLSAVGKK